MRGGEGYYDNMSPVFGGRRSSIFSHKSQTSPGKLALKHGSQDDIIPVSPVDQVAPDELLPSAEPSNIIEATFNLLSTVQSKNGSDWTDHVVICDLGHEFPPHLASFIGPFRVHEPRRPVVILNATPPTDTQWEILSAFGNVYYVQGTSLSRVDLEKANITKAWKAIIFAKKDGRW